MAYTQWASVLGISLRVVEVDVEMDYDNAGYFGTTDANPGPTRVRYTVRIVSDAPESELLNLIEKADRHSPLHDIFARVVPMKRIVKITKETD